MISEITLNLDKDTDKKYIYGGLFDFYADTKENLDKFTSIMLENGLFNFSNTGRYVGVDNKKNMHWTFDDGKPSVEWLFEVLDVINSINKNGNDIAITVDKEYLMTVGGVRDITKEDIEDVENREGIIDLYIYHLRKILKKGGYESLLRDTEEGTLCETISSRIEDNMLIVAF